MSGLVTRFIIFQTTRSQIVAAGVALLAGYFLNFLLTILVDVIGLCSDSRPDTGRRLRDQVSRHLWVFGVGCMFSISGIPGLHGTFHAILAWIAWVFLVAMHIVYMLPCVDPFGRWRIISTILFYLTCVVWYIGIVAYFFAYSQGL